MAIAAAAGPAAAVDCRAPAAPKVVVDRFSVPITVEAQASREALLKQPGWRGSRAADAVIDKSWDVKPLYGIEVRPQSFCGVPSEVRIAATYAKRAIVIANELAADACVSQELIGMYTRELRAEELALERAAQAARPDLRRFLAGQALPQRATREEAIEDARRLVDDWFAGWRAALDADEARRRADSTGAAERQRLIAACDGRLREIVEAAVPAAPAPVAAAAPTPMPPGTTPAVAPPPAGTPTFAGAVQPITTPLVLKVQPFSMRPLIVVGTAIRTQDGTPRSVRTVRVGRIEAERRGADIVKTVRLDRVEGGDDAPAPGMAVIVTTDAWGRVKDKRIEWPPGKDARVSAVVRGVVDAVMESGAIAPKGAGGYPEQGIKTGDVVNVEVDELLSIEFRHTVRGLATHEGRKVVVVDIAGTSSDAASPSQMNGYGLIDAETGALVYSSEIGVETSRVGGKPVTTELRIVRKIAEPASGP